MLKSFKASSPGRQLALFAAGAALICALLAFVYVQFLRTDYEVLFADLRTADAATIVAELDKEKVPYRLERDGTRILVPGEIVDGTRLDIMGRDLPLKGMVGFELFNKSDMGLTEFAQKINYQRALQGELARTIMAMDGVDTVRVHLSLSERTIFRDDKVPPKASVTVMPRADARMSRATVRGIQRLVAAAVPELDAASVVVLDGSGEVMSGEGPTEAPLSAGMEAKQAVEAYYAGEVTRAVARVYPAADVEVSVWAGPPLRLGDEMGAADDASFVGWTPASRSFRLRVAVSVDEALGAPVQEEIGALAGDVIAVDPARGDIVTVSAAAAAGDRAGAWSSGAETRSSAAAGSDSAREEEGMSAGLGLWVGLGLVVLLAGLAALRGRGGPARDLTPQQRSDFADRFRTLLERSEADAA